MRLARRLGTAFTLTIAAILIFILLSSAFAASYIFVDYKKYLKTYKELQAGEITAIHQRSEGMLKNLKDLLHLAEVCIQAAHGNPQRLQRILSSLHQLQASQALAEFQKVSYDTLSLPLCLLIIA